MRKIIYSIAAAASLGLGLGAVNTAAAADHRGEIIERYCQDNNGDGQCDDWKSNHDKWDDAHYRAWYAAHREHIRQWYAAHHAQYWKDDSSDIDVTFSFHS